MKVWLYEVETDFYGDGTDTWVEPRAIFNVYEEALAKAKEYFNEVCTVKVEKEQTIVQGVNDEGYYVTIYLTSYELNKVYE